MIMVVTMHDGAGCADNICETAKVSLKEMNVQSKGVHERVMQGLKPVAKSTFKFPLYNQVGSANNTSVSK